MNFPRRHPEPKKVGRGGGATAGEGASSFGEFQASLLFCNQCKRAMPVRERLLLHLPDGAMYDYVCEACGSSVGTKRSHSPVGQR